LIPYDHHMQAVGQDLPQPQRLSALDLDLAPSVPGIYAWYAHVALSENDWTPRIRDGVDRAAGDLRKAVVDYARIHRPGPVDLKGDGSYGLKWRGSLQRESIADADVDEGPSRVEERLKELSADANSRRVLLQLLEAATPIFASPLYVGVAINLRVRLAEHRAAYEGAMALLRNDPSAATQLQFHGGSFGERLAGAGVKLERLTCWVLPTVQMVSHADADETESELAAEQKYVAQTVEWILQRIFQPALGRQLSCR
jgi:hypothetical protein